MIKKLLITAIVIYVTFRPVDSSLPCKFISTINITSGYKDAIGNFVYKDDVYPRGAYNEFRYIEDFDGKRTVVEPHIRGCICNLKPCIRFCCDDDQDCEKIDKFIVTNEEYKQEVIDLNSRQFEVLKGRPCQTIYSLEPEDYPEDTWRFLNNGSIISNEIVHNAEDYCLEVNNLTTTVNLCFRPHQDVRFAVYPIGMLISIPFLIITFCVYAFIPELRNLHGKCLLCYIFALITLYTALTIVQTQAFGIELGMIDCYALGCLVYFSVMLMFFWMNVMCYDIWTIARNGIANRSFRGEVKIFFKYCIYAFGFPLLITTIVILIDQYDLLPFALSPAIASSRCYIQQNIKTEAIYVYIPISIIMLMNVAFFVDTAIKIWKAQSASSDDNSEKRKKHIKRRLYIYLRLFIVMGILWCMEIISWMHTEKKFIFYITDFLNCIQGLWIFLVCVCDIRTRRLIAKRCCPSSISIEESEEYAGDYGVTNETMKMSETK